LSIEGRTDIPIGRKWQAYVELSRQMSSLLKYDWKMHSHVTKEDEWLDKKVSTRSKR